MRFQLHSLVLVAACSFAASALASAGHQGTIGDTKLSAKGHVEMVFVPDGAFTMGGVSMRPGVPALDPKGDTGPWIKIDGPNGGYTEYHNDEGPKHSVNLDGYWIGKNLVTVAQFREFTKTTRYRFNWKAIEPQWGWIDSHPMVLVTWADARAYCKWAGGDLPTEAQWEKAARGTDGREFPWGNEWDATRLWSGHRQTTAPVGSFPAGASPYGCLDMAGNVWEWCLDWYGSDYADQKGWNPTGVETGQNKIVRGGDFDLTQFPEFRCSSRYAADPKAGACVYGFRLVSK